MRFTFIRGLSVFLLLITSQFLVYATGQAPDRLIINGDTLQLHALPLEQWKKQNTWDKPFFTDSLSGINTGCWRGYVAHWEVKNNHLYLTDIWNCDLNAKADLNDLFPGKVRANGVYADWFTDTVTAYQGELIFYDHSGFSAIYASEHEFVFSDGSMTSQAFFDNSMSKNTPMFMWSCNELEKFTDSLINWGALPPIEQDLRVVLRLETDEHGSTKFIDFILRKSEPYNQEALRVLPLLAHRLPIIYKRGRYMPKVITLCFVFTAEKQRRFTNTRSGKELSRGGILERDK